MRRSLPTLCLLAACASGSEGPQGPAGPPGPTGPKGPEGSTPSAACLDIREYGGAGGDSTDNQPALLAAFAALRSTGGCIAFPGGTFRFDSTATLTYPAGPFSLTLSGAGAAATTLHWPSGAEGLVLTHASPAQTSHVRDLAISTGLAGSGTGLTLQLKPSAGLQGAGLPSPSDVTNVSLLGDDYTGTGGTHAWGTGIAVAGVSFVDFNGILVSGGTGAEATGLGTGLSIAGLPPTGGGQPVFGLYYNVTASYFINLAVGLLYGTYVQGVTVNTTNFQNGGIGITDDSGEQGLGNLTVQGSQFNTLGPALIRTLSGFQVQLVNDIFLVLPNQIGVDLEQGSLASIVGSNFWPGSPNAGGVGVAVGKGAQAGNISGNVFLNLNTGVKLLQGSGGTNVQSNSYTGSGTHVVDQGTNDKVGGGSD